MNDFASVLSTALRDEAEEISMSVDMNEGSTKLDQRLDAADRSRRRRTWLAVAAAAVVVAGVAVGLRALTAQHDPAPVAPSPTPSRTAAPYTSSAFVVPMTLTPPGWTVPSTTTLDDLAPTRIVWGQSECAPPAPCDWGADFGLRIVAPATYWAPTNISSATPVRSYAQYAAYVGTWSAAGIPVSDRVDRKVGGRDAVVVTIKASAPTQGVFGCELATEARPNCWSPEPSLVIRFAVVDAPGHPIILWTKASEKNPAVSDALSAFDTMLDSVVFGPAPSAS